MLNRILNFFSREYKTLNIIEVSKKNLLENYEYLSSLSTEVKVAPVIKSNAYGHNMTTVAKILDYVHAPFFCVDSLYEAYELLKSRIKTPILIMGSTEPSNLKVKKLPFAYAVYDLDFLKALDKYQPDAKVHLYVDTGLHREGILMDELSSFLGEARNLSSINIEGLMSHFASSDDKKDSLNNLQIKNFKKALDILKKHGIKPKWIHLQNSDGLTNLGPLGLDLTMARAGLASYGISKDKNLKPVLSLKSKIIQIKKIGKGERVGYNGIFKAQKEIILGILPIGYYDGVDRGLSNKGFVKVGNKFCKIIGRVSMNVMAIDLSNIENPRVGDQVIIYSNDPKDKNSIQNTATICKKIPYEILVNLAPSTRRIIV